MPSWVSPCPRPWVFSVLWLLSWSCLRCKDDANTGQHSKYYKYNIGGMCVATEWYKKYGVNYDVCSPWICSNRALSSRIGSALQMHHRPYKVVKLIIESFYLSRFIILRTTSCHEILSVFMFKLCTSIWHRLFIKWPKCQKIILNKNFSLENTWMTYCGLAV